jgi:hypothetical protein
VIDRAADEHAPAATPEHPTRIPIAAIFAAPAAAMLTALAGAVANVFGGGATAG